ncbi:Endoglucanase-like protein [Hapsidospora chrysogenum ATCC 11550]|uniref:Endoglucanase-like protein n=1 Tax=Hapsidospora chrysogenum (strain ATCC 11550 / CBS 779.69 / DSM 880 / IAM 14645 / JCM 23072 / IMI 49137) TaxID=857340 RepID=A0A086T812_HAPC1|nr:Endoglucanase-like protein [Hapsidospora chrysogenum ATCC 11550]
MNGDMKVFSFVAPEEIRTFEQDIRPFFDHITDAHGFPAQNQHLITLQFGTEPFTGNNAQFDVYYWYGAVN